MAAATKEEKLQIGLQHKAAGNSAFGKQDFGEALRFYHLAVLYLTGLENDSTRVLGMLSSEQDNTADGANAEAKTTLGAVHCNMALIYLKKQKYTSAVLAAEKSLRCSDSPTTALKAKYRKAQALRLSGDVYKARDYISDLLNSSTNAEEQATLRAELKLAQNTIDALDAQSKNKWKGFLSKSPRVFDTTESQATQQQADV